MVETLRHRGPDEEGIEVDGGVGLGMRRLSIIDLTEGSQPIHNEDRTVRVVFNGEIYNYRELRKRLVHRGHVFATGSDTEVIVHAYEEYGADFPEQLNGMFAIALHDLVRGRVLLVRDPIGIKPLYYAMASEFAVWGSEIKAVLASGLVARELDFDALGEFLAWEYVPAPRTLFRGIRKLPPGCVLDLDLENPDPTPRTYWHLKPAHGELDRTDDEWGELLEEQLLRSTRRQMVSDVPLGAFLSGGVDSSLIAWSMGDALTFSIGFDDPSYNELGWARKVADHLGVSHVQETLQSNAWTLFDELMYFMDDPIGDFSIFPTYLVSRLAREHVKVVLSGDGGDEILGGYETYVANGMARQYGRLPAVLRRGVIGPLVASLAPRPEKKGLINKSKRFLEGLEYPDHLEHARWRIFAGEEALSALLTPDAQAERRSPVDRHITSLFGEAEGHGPVGRLLYVDLKSYLSDNILPKVDRMSMAVSLEARVPYLDTDMVELAFQVPDHLKVDRRGTKVLLKEIASRHLPRACVYRPKEGFSIPMKRWLRGPFRPTMEAFLCEDRVREQGIFRSETVSRLKREHLEGTANHSHVIWSLIVFQAWRDRWLDQP